MRWSCGVIRARPTLIVIHGSGHGIDDCLERLKISLENKKFEVNLRMSIVYKSCLLACSRMAFLQVKSLYRGYTTNKCFLINLMRHFLSVILKYDLNESKKELI